jgi:LmbE family N-acetylglucosaminyl deacetylase
MTQKKLLAVLAHPDDESFGPGGTFAKYAHAGVDVHICIATDGAAGSVAKGFEEAREKLAEIRAAELVSAVNTLGATLHRLDYQDSGMAGSRSNDHPAAWINADETEAVGRVVRLIREVRPNTIVTHDSTGGYFHPDHIQCYKITTKAFHLAGDALAYPEQNLPPFTPERLYYTAFSYRWTRLFATLMRIRGQDPTALGRNKDIDLTKLGVSPKQLHAVIDYRKYWDVKSNASRAHATQGGGTGGGPFGMIPMPIRKRLFGRDTFMRGFPPVPDGFKERDLFA